MIASTQAFADRISGNARQHRARFLLNGESISGDIKSVIVQKGSCGESAFSIGAVYSATITAQIDNCTESLQGQELDFQMGLLLEDDNEDSVEYISIGRFVVTDAKKSPYSVSITGSGRLAAKCWSVYVPGISFPAMIGAVLDDLAQQTGCPIDASAFSDMLHLTIEKRPTALLQVEMLGVVAGLFGGYVTESSVGVITFAKYSTAPTAAITADQSTQPYEFSEKDASINGIRVTVSEAVQDEDGEIEMEGVSYEYGTPDVTLANEYMTQEIFNAMVGNIVDYTYRPANMPISLGDIRLEAFDVLLVRDSTGMAYTVPCMSVVHTYDGGVSTTVIAPDRDAQQEPGGALLRAVDRMSAQMGVFEKIVAGKASFTELEAVKASIEALDTDFLRADSAVIKDLQSNSLHVDFANIDFEKVNVGNIATLFANIGLIDRATIVDGHITGFLDAVKVNANDITAGTLSVERLVIAGSDKSIVYAINNAGELTSASVDTIDGAAITKRTITADHIVTKSLTSNEIDVDDLFAQTVTATNLTISGNSKLQDITASNITLSGNINANNGTITGGTLKGNTIQSNTYSYTSGNYSASGIQIGLTGNGFIRAKNFGIDSNGSAYFKGNISGSVISGSKITGTDIDITSAYTSQDALGNMTNTISTPTDTYGYKYIQLYSKASGLRGYGALYVKPSGTEIKGDVSISGNGVSEGSLEVSGALYASNFNGYTLAAACARGVKTLTAKGTLGWGTNNNYLADLGMLAFWNGAYSGTNSNLTYCAYGTIIGTSNISNYANLSRIKLYESAAKSITVAANSNGSTTVSVTVGAIYTGWGRWLCPRCENPGVQIGNWYGSGTSDNTYTCTVTYRNFTSSSITTKIYAYRLATNL